MKKYDSYKDSGVEWIGEIPDTWQIKKLKYFANVVLGKMLTSDDKGGYHLKPYLRAKNIEWRNVNVDDVKEMWFSKKDLEQFRIQRNDLLVSEGGEVGRTSLWRNELDECYIQNSVHKVTMLSNEDPLYFLNQFVLFGFKGHFDAIVNRISIAHLTKEKLNGISFVYPPVEEQTQIANYLNHKTTEIDSLIENKEKLITLLKEERTAVINQAVTKGLDSNVSIKSSGFEWLGKVPEHWESWKIGHAFKEIGSGTTPKSGEPIYHKNGTINWLNTGDLNDGVLNSCSKKITEKALIDYTSLKLFPKESLVIAMYGATIGKTAILNFETTTNQASCVFGKSEIISIYFLQYWFKAKKDHIINLSIGGGQPNISQFILKGIRLYCPNIKEQEEIVDFLNPTCKFSSKKMTI